MFKPMFALHKDRSGNVLGASSFKRNYEFADWVRSIDVRPGDILEFGAAAERPDFDEVEPSFTPAFIETPPSPTPETDRAVIEDQPF